ncbi:redoxin domain-containing protein [Bacillus massiliigorillae]|uniref:redoxin domain-containing protein n=1 Tax=Bacillus massiliigorillae TaxID=1243664 RepID=UPI0003A63449|nr:redoxin domain-containing protein [Bacillus massiliigorillae]
MKRKIFNTLILVAFILLIGINIWQHNGKNKEVTEKDSTAEVSSTPSAKIGNEQGQMAPDFTLNTLDGKAIKLSDLRGQKVILNFWATWCPPCKAEMPHMQNFYEKNKDKDVTLIAVNLTNQDKGIETVHNFANDYKLTFPILLDEQGAVGSTYQIMTIPTSLFIDEKGKIQQKVVGPMDEETIQKYLSKL